MRDEVVCMLSAGNAMVSCERLRMMVVVMIK